ncbi:MAG: hypothetical protein M0Q45_10490 [Bacteroidales bacterium]|nr:hypothetical protein [Bacteroidales bacterium]MCK9499914.1 hypothetical protein [Bacteroidales bacterium]MDY0315963.1 hypothetical protein [Bacteroidales bacterium]
MKKIFYIFTLVIFCENIYSQEIIKSNYTKGLNAFEIDKLNNFYFVKDNQVVKTDFEFNKLYDYSDKTFGNITFIDVSNPFRILIFYKDFNIIVFLDNKLAPLRSPIYLDDLNYFSVDALCSSSFESFLIFDSQNTSVNTISKELQTTQKGTNLYAVVSDQKARKIKETNNYIFISFENGYIHVLDKYANYIDSFFYEGLIDFDCVNDDLYLLGHNELVAFNIKKERIFYYNFDYDANKGFKIKNNTLYLLNEKSLISFKFL